MAALAPADAAGCFQRRPAPPNADSPAQTLAKALAAEQAPWLIVGRSCPWAHRTWLLHRLRRLEGSIRLVIVEPDPNAGRWVFPEPQLGCSSLQQLYQRCGCPPSLRATVPLLLDPGGPHQPPRLLNNESAELLEVLNLWPTSQPMFASALNDPWAARLQHSVNDGVYRCGFARNQTAYNGAEAELFECLAELESKLAAAGPWLAGSAPGLLDLRLFPTLIRWEQVYAPLFGCSRLPLWHFPALWRWRAQLMQLPGVAECCDPLAWRRDYFGALFPLRPSGVVPAGSASVEELRRLVQCEPPQPLHS
jgi:putative glutathione S-transferase